MASLARQRSPPLPESHVCNSRLCGVCPRRWQRDPGPGFQSHCARTKRTSWLRLTRFQRPHEAYKPALRLETEPERRYSLEPNERNFLSLGANFAAFSNVPFRIKRIR
jgi:hypothetical protein